MVNPGAEKLFPAGPPAEAAEDSWRRDEPGRAAASPTAAGRAAGLGRLLIWLAVLTLAGCGGSVYGRSGAGGGVGASVPAVVWAAPE